MVKTFEEFTKSKYDIFDVLKEIEDTYWNISLPKDEKFITTKINGDIVTSNILLGQGMDVVYDKTKYKWVTTNGKHKRVVDDYGYGREYIDSFNLEIIYDKSAESFTSIEIASYSEDFVEYLEERGVTKFKTETYNNHPVLVFCSEYDHLNTNFSFENLFDLINLIYEYHLDSGDLPLDKK